LLTKAGLRLLQEATVAGGIDERVRLLAALQAFELVLHAVEFAVVGEEDVAFERLPGGEAALEVAGDVRVALVGQELDAAVHVGARKKHHGERLFVLTQLHGPRRRAEGVARRQVGHQRRVTQRHAVPVVHSPIDRARRPAEDAVEDGLARAAVLDEGRVRGRNHDLGAGLLPNEGVRLHVVDVRMARQDELDVAIPKAELLDVGLEARHGRLEPGVEQDVALGRRDQKQRDVVGADVVDVPDHAVRVEVPVRRLHVAWHARPAGAASERKRGRHGQQRRETRHDAEPSSPSLESAGNGVPHAGSLAGGGGSWRIG
jgi:hypothetical protein